MRKLIFLLFLLPCLAVFAKDLSPVGYWQQINEKTQQPQSIIQIWPNSDGTLAGKILGLYPVKGRELAKYCEKCKGDKKNQPIIGMTIISQMSQANASLTWTDGEILDPKVGSSYRCKMTLSQDDKTLQVRGYVGIPLLGRSQTWHRLDTTELKQAMKVVKAET